MTRSSSLAAIVLAIAMAMPLQGQIGARTMRPVQQTPDVYAAVPGDDNTQTACAAKPGWTPTGSKPDLARCFWNQAGEEYLKYGRFVTTSKTVTAATDVLSDAVYGVRLTFSTAVAASTEGKTEASSETVDGEPTLDQDRNLNLLAANGGNVSMTAAYPIYYKPFGGSGGQLLWNSYARGAGNFQAFGASGTSSTDWQDFNGNVEIAPLEVQADLFSAEKKFNLLGYAKLSGVLGTKEFRTSIGAQNGAFAHSQVGVGVRFADLLAVYLTWNSFSDGKIPGDGAVVTVAIGK